MVVHMFGSKSFCCAPAPHAVRLVPGHRPKSWGRWERQRSTLQRITNRNPKPHINILTEHTLSCTKLTRPLFIFHRHGPRSATKNEVSELPHRPIHDSDCEKYIFSSMLQNPFWVCCHVVLLLVSQFMRPEICQSHSNQSWAQPITCAADHTTRTHASHSPSPPLPLVGFLTHCSAFAASNSASCPHVGHGS